MRSAFENWTPSILIKNDQNWLVKSLNCRTFQNILGYFLYSSYRARKWKLRGGEGEEEEREEKRKIALGYKKAMTCSHQLLSRNGQPDPFTDQSTVCGLNAAPHTITQWVILPQVKPKLHVLYELNLRGLEEPVLCSLLLDSNWTPVAFHFHRWPWRTDSAATHWNLLPVKRTWC